MTDWNLAAVWAEIAGHQPAGPALIQGDRNLSWSSFDQRAERLAGALVTAGLRPQAKVAQLLYNCPEYLESLYAVIKAALVPVNSNYRYQPHELARLWDDADVEAVVFHASLAGLAGEARSRLPGIRAWYCVSDGPEPVPEWAVQYEEVVSSPAAHPARGLSGDDLILLYTGGTTGSPKGVMWRQDDLFSLLNRVAEVRYEGSRAQGQIGTALAASRHPPPRLLVAPPLMHGAGLLTALSALNSGGCIVLATGRSFDAATLLATAAREHVTQLSIVGDAYARPLAAELDAHPNRYDLSSLWLITSSGMIWSDSIKQVFRRHNPRALLVDALGSTEAPGLGRSVSRAQGSSGFQPGAGACVLREDGEPVTPGSGDIGLLAVRGRGSLGYYKDPVKTAQVFRMIGGERYSIPGDYATVDSDGTIRLIGRGSLCINTGGEKVFAEEVEQALRTQPGITDAAVLGEPDLRLGEKVVAVVELDHSAAVDVNQMISRARDSLAHFKVPRRVVVTTHRIRGDNGKVNYPAMRRLLASTLCDG